MPLYQGTPKLIVMGEYGTDPDEQLSLILAAGLHEFETVQLEAVIGNHTPALARARSAKQTLVSLGVGYIYVGVGEESFSASGEGVETDPAFLSSPSSVGRRRVGLSWTLERALPQSVTLVINSGFTDIAWLWQDNPNLFLDKVNSVVLMSGIETDGNAPQLNKSGHLVPSLGKGGAANNCFDPGATLHVYDAMQRHGVPLVITTRFAAYQAKLPVSLFTDMAATGHPLGIRLCNIERESINGLWAKVMAPAGSETRGTLPPDRDRQWFADTFCGGVVPTVKSAGDVFDFVTQLALYDPMNVIAATPSLVSQFYEPYEVELPSARGPVVHRVIGLSESVHGVRDPQGLKEFMSSCIVNTLRNAQVFATNSSY